MKLSKVSKFQKAEIFLVQIWQISYSCLMCVLQSPKEKKEKEQELSSCSKDGDVEAFGSKATPSLKECPFAGLPCMLTIYPGPYFGKWAEL